MKHVKHLSDPVHVLRPLQARVPFVVVGERLFLAHGCVLSEFALPGMLFTAKYLLEGKITALAGGTDCIYAAVVNPANPAAGIVSQLSSLGCKSLHQIALPQQVEHLSADGAWLAATFGRNTRLYLNFAQMNYLQTQDRVLSVQVADGNAVLITSREAFVLGVKSRRKLTQTAVAALFYKKACFVSSRDNTLDCLDIAATNAAGAGAGGTFEDAADAPALEPLNSRFLNTFFYQMAACGEMALCIGEEGRLFAFNLLQQQSGLVFDGVAELHVDGARAENIIQIATFSNYLVFQDHEMTLTVVPLQTVQSIDGGFYARSLTCVSAAFGEVLAAASFERFVAFSGSSNKLFLMDLAQYHEDLQREALMLKYAEEARNALENQRYEQSQAGERPEEPQATEAVGKAPELADNRTNEQLAGGLAAQRIGEGGGLETAQNADLAIYYANLATKGVEYPTGRPQAPEIVPNYYQQLSQQPAGRTALAEAYKAHAEVITHVVAAGGFLFSASSDAVVVWQRRPWATVLQNRSAFCSVRQADFVRDALVPVLKFELSGVQQVTAFDVIMGRTRYTMALGAGTELWTLEFYGVLRRLTSGATVGDGDKDECKDELKDADGTDSYARSDGELKDDSTSAFRRQSGDSAQDGAGNAPSDRQNCYYVSGSCASQAESAANAFQDRYSLSLPFSASMPAPDDFCVVVQPEFVKTTAHTDYVNTVLFLSHELLVSGSADKSLALWNVSHTEKQEARQEVTVYDIFTNRVDRKRKLAIYNDYARIQRLFDLQNVSKRTIWHVSRWGSLLCVSSGDKKLRVVKVEQNQLRVVKTLEGFQFSLVKAFFLNESQIISLYYQGTVSVTNVGTGEVEFLLDVRYYAYDGIDEQAVRAEFRHGQEAATERVEFGTYTLLCTGGGFLVGTSRGELLELCDDSELLRLRAEADAVRSIESMQAFNESLRLGKYAYSVLIAVEKEDAYLLFQAAYECLDNSADLTEGASLHLSKCYFVLQSCCRWLRTARRCLQAVFLLDFVFRQVSIARMLEAYGEPCRMLLYDALRYVEKHRERLCEMRGQARVI